MSGRHRGLAGGLALAAALALAACGNGVPAAPPTGKMPITTSSKAALKEYLRGRDLVEKLRTGEARAHFQRAVELDPEFALAHLGVAQTATGPTEFFPALRRALELVDRCTPAEANLIRVAEAGVNSKPDEQKRLLEENVKAYPDDERAQFALALFYFNTQQWEASIQHDKRATEIAPDYSPPYNHLGYAHRFLDRDEEAEKAFRTYIELLPNEPNPYDSHAELLLHLGRYRESIAEYEKALEINPNFPSAYIGIGHALIFLGNPEEARKSFIKLRFIARNDGERRQAFTWLAASHLFEGDHDGAIREIEERMEIALKAGDRASVSGDTELIGELLLDAGRAAEAQVRFDEALKLLDEADVPAAIRETGHVDYLFDCARIDLARGDVDAAEAKAKQHRERAKERGVPDEVRLSHLLAGLIAGRRGDHRAAVKEIAKANLNSKRILLALARAQEAAGDLDAAIATCRRAAQFDTPDLDYALARRPALELLGKLTGNPSS